jgi:pilus assembly protein CpaE
LSRAHSRQPEPDKAAGGGWDAWLLCPDRRMASELTVLLAQDAPSMQVTHCVDYAAAWQRATAAGGRPPMVCFLDVCSNRNEALGLLPRLAEPPLQVPIVALISEDNPGLALRCLRMGASGCLIHPFDDDQLLPVLSRIGYLDLSPEAAGAPHKVLAVLPAKGSSGATTLAANLACLAGRTGFGRVLLADMDPLAGTLAFVLKLKSPFSFADALAHSKQLDADLWRGLVTPYRGLDVLLSPENPSDCDSDAAGVSSLLAYAKRVYDLIVLDTGSPYSVLGLQLLKSSHEILLVTTTTFGSIYGARRALRYLSDNNASLSKVRLVLRHWRRESGLEQEEIESALGMSIYHVLPSDPQSVEDALLEGRPVSPGSPYGKSLAELASRVLQRDAEDARRPSPLKGLRSLFSRGT